VGRQESRLSTVDGALSQFAGDLRRLREQAGCLTYRELSRRAHYSAAALSEAASGRKLPSLSVTLAYVQACDGDESQWKDRWHGLAAELAAGRGAGDDGRGPYVGLAAFQVTDADQFFGRDALTDQLVKRVREGRLLGVFGASGAGKSSVLRAGLAARAMSVGLQQPGLQPVLVFTPGPHPMEECAIQLAALGGASATELRAEFTSTPEALHLRVRQAMAAAPPGVDLLVVVDQFEQIFTLCERPEERAWLVEALLFAAQTPTSRVRVVLGVRADFHRHCTQYPKLVEALRDRQIVVGPMSTEELRQAVTLPASGAGCTVETALVSRLFADATGQPAALPLVSHALLETWKRRRGTTLTVTGYEAAGGIEHAIARTAEDVYTGLDGAGRRSARQIFLRLTAIGEAAEDTRRRVHRRELDHEPSTGGVLEKLTEARLVTVDHDSIQIAHEALLRCWPRLRGWLIADRGSLRLHRQLTEATEVWRSLGRDPAALYRGNRLVLGIGNDAALTAREREFLEASLFAEANEQAADRSRTRRLRQLLALLSGLLLVAVTSISLAVHARDSAAQQRDIAIARQIISDAQALEATNPALAVQLRLAAYRLAPAPEIRDSLFSTFATPYASRLTGHTDAVWSAAFRPDGRVLASASTDNTARLWDVATAHRPRELATLTGHTDVVNCAEFSPDGRTLATGSNDHTVRLWDTSDPRRPRELAILTGHTGSVASVAFSPDGRTLATASNDHTVRLWDTSDPRRPRELAILTGHTDHVNAVVFRPDGGALATVSSDGTARLWDITARAYPAELAVLAGHTGVLTSVAFSPDGRTLATASNDHTVRLWDVIHSRQPRGLAVVTGHTGTVTSVAFSPDGRSLATASEDKTARLWSLDDLGHPRAYAVLTGHTNAVNAVVFSPDGATLATASSDKTLRLGDTDEVALDHTDGVESAVFSPDGRILATASDDHTARLWDVQDIRHPRALSTLAGHHGTVWSAVFSPDGRTLATADDDRTAGLWDVSDPGRPTQLATLTGHADIVWSVAFSADGHTLATASNDRTARLWDVSDVRHPRAVASLAGPTNLITSVAFSPRGHTLATANTNKVARLWDLRDPGHPTELATLAGHANAVTRSAFSPDGRILATANWDHTVRLWDITQPRRPVELATLTGHTDTVTSVVFSPDSRTLATAGSDNTARLWDITDPRRPRDVATLSGHTNTIVSVAFSPDGRTLATASSDHTARLWDTDVDRVAARICQLAYPVITRAEWRQYLPGPAYHPPCP
jgi:WD40 repeat protein